MRRFKPIQKFLTAAFLAACLMTGYLSASIVTARPAYATCVPCITFPCVNTDGLSDAFDEVNSDTIEPKLETAETQINAKLILAISGFASAVDARILVAADNIADWLDTFWLYGLEPAMKGIAAQLITVNSMNSATTGMFKDASALNRRKREFEAGEIASHREQRVGENVSAAGTVAGGMTRSSLFSRDYNTVSTVERIGRSGGASSTAASTGPAADMKERWENYISRYCDEKDNNGVSGCSGTGSFAGQDTDVAGIIFAKETINLGDADVKKTVDDLIANIAEPFVKPPVAAGAVDNPGEAMQEAILAAEAYKAKRQVIYNALYHAVSRRAPGSRMGIWVREIREAAGVDPAAISANPSYNELMQAMMSERFQNGRYALGQVDEPENNRRELVIQQAYQLMQMSDQLDLMDRYALVLAAQAGAKIRKSKNLGSAAEGAPLK